jgi:DNA repair ATPase RecN
MYSKIYDYVDEEIVLNRIINNATRYFINNTEVDKQKLKIWRILWKK